MSALTPKQKRFCEEYVIDFNGAQAAIRAGFSKNAAKEQAARLLTKANITEYVKILQTKLQERSQITADMVINELAKCGFSNIQDFIERGNSTVDLSEVDARKAAAVSSVKVTNKTYGSGEDTTVEQQVEFKLYDKVSALNLLGKHFGTFDADNRQKASKFVVKLK